MITASVMSAMGSRRLGLILGVPTVLLTVGAVYCQMHYGVDVLGGVLVAGVVLLGIRELGGGELGTPSSLPPSSLSPTS